MILERPEKNLVLIVFLVLSTVVTGCSTLSKLTKPNASPEPEVPVQEYRINHNTQGSGILPAVVISHGEILRFVVRETDPNCYHYNAEQVFHPDLGAAESAEPVILEITHDESVSAYMLNITKRPGSEARCTETRTWQIPVMATWNLAGAGGLGLHDLGDPVYYLEPGERTKPNGQAETGYFVRRNEDVEDSNRFTGLAFAHLFRASRGWNGIAWAPLSVGLSAANGDESYLLGTTLRFGRKFYLTGGRIFGQVDRLPDDLRVDAFTTDNSLGTLPTRRSDAWFLGFSYAFLEGGVSDLFKTKVGIPSPSRSSPSGPASPAGGAAPDPLALRLSPQEGAPGIEVVVTPPQGQTFGGNEDQSSVVVGSTSHAANTLGEKWSDQRITVTIPADATGEVPVVVRKRFGDGEFDFGKATFRVVVPENDDEDTPSDDR